MARQRNRRERTAVRGLGWCLRTQGVVVVCLAVNHPHSDSLCCLWAQCPSATCGCAFSLCYSVGTTPCWWISTFCPWAAKRTLAGLPWATSRYRHGEMGVVVSKCEGECMASFLLETFWKDSRSVESKTTLSHLYFHCCRICSHHLLGHLWRFSTHVCLFWSLSFTRKVKSKLVFSYPFNIYLLSWICFFFRKLRPWFRILWIRGFSSMQSSSAVEDSPNRRRSCHQLQPFLSKVTHRISVLVILDCFF